MKYIVVLGDGMSDEPIDELGGKTPLQVAMTPTLDWLAQRGVLGLAQTIPEGMYPGSDTANLAVMGYDPRTYYTGRAPFEAASMRVPLADTDTAFRCNLVTLSQEEPYAQKTMVDHSADEITSEEARLLMEAVSRSLQTEALAFYPGVSYRHLMVWKDAPQEFRLTPPHDVLGRRIGEHLPNGADGDALLRLMEESSRFLPEHPVNWERQARGLRPGNSIWIWGQGRRPQLPPFTDKYGLRGSVICGVDLVKGIGLVAGLRSIDVPGATGTLHTNYHGKAMAAVAELQGGQDFVYVHIEAADECGHRGEVRNKVKAIENVDQKVVRVIVEELNRLGEEYRLMVLPDHPTPLRLRTHTSDPVPFLIYQNSSQRAPAAQGYDELSAQRTGLLITEGYTLMDRFLAGGLE